MRASTTIKLLSIFSLVVLAACGDASTPEASVALKPKITIGSTTDPRSKMVAEIYGQALEQAEFRIARKQPFETSAELLTAMTSGEVQLAGMTTQGLFTLLQAPSGTPAAMPKTTTDQAAEIAKALPANVKMAVPSTAEDKDVVFCSKTFTDANTIATLTDLGTKPGTATLAAPDSFEAATPLGAAGLKNTYQVEFKSIVPTASDKIVEAVTAGTTDCGVGYSADPGLSAATLTVLQDDKALVPNDVILPLVAGDAGAADALSVLDATSGRLTTEVLRTLYQRLKVDGASPELVANEFTGPSGSG